MASAAVVDSMAKLSVGGEVDLNYAPSGLMWRLTCPVANAVEPLGKECRPARGEQKAVPRAPVVPVKGPP